MTAVLSGRGHSVLTTDSRTLDISKPYNLDFIPTGASVLISIPTLQDGDRTAEIVDKLGRGPRRVVYLSTTGVYGQQTDVNELSEPSSNHPRIEAERAVLDGPWSPLVLRPAAIYGPGRGVHVNMARGTWQLVGDGTNFVSRIHVDDLANIVAAALLRDDVTGAYPVADDEPCTSGEIARFCADLLGLPMPSDSVPADSVHHTRRADRRVDGRAIRRLLRVELAYPSYRTGIPALLF